MKRLLGFCQLRLVASAMLLLCGCALPIPSHIHDDAALKTAQGAEDTMTDYAKDSPQMYAAMLQNVDLFKIQEEDLLSQLAANESTALVTQFPSMTNGEFEDRIGDEKQQAESARRAVKQAAIDVWTRMKIDTAEINGLNDAVDKAQKSVDKAKGNVTAWNKDVALVQVAIAKVPPAQLESSNPSDLKTLADSVSKEPVNYVDADGKSQATTVGDILNDNAGGIAAIGSDQGSLQLETKKIVAQLVPTPPGVALVTANLALQIARIERQKAQLQLSQTRNLLALLQNSSAQLAIAVELLDQADTIYSVAGSSSSLSKPISDVVKELSHGSNGVLELPRQQTSLPFTFRQGRPKAVQRDRDARPAKSEGNHLTAFGKQQALAGLLFALRYEAVAESIISRVSSINVLEFARLEHVDSIESSQLNDQENQALITSGISGLVSYHQGGLTAQDIANLLSFAQAVAVGILAGKVN